MGSNRVHRHDSELLNSPFFFSSPPLSAPFFSHIWIKPRVEKEKTFPELLAKSSWVKNWLSWPNVKELRQPNRFRLRTWNLLDRILNLPFCQSRLYQAVAAGGEGGGRCWQRAKHFQMLHIELWEPSKEGWGCWVGSRNSQWLAGLEKGRVQADFKCPSCNGIWLIVCVCLLSTTAVVW